MAYDYSAIRADNQRKYGTDIGRIGPMLLADRYDDRTHFIFELLQNAEDAFKRRQDWQGKKAVEFTLRDNSLCVSHFGIPFSENDVRGICGIGESTKDLTSIGRFGIGFKSVYAFTDCPAIHSAGEHFAIESFVWPKAIPEIKTEPGQTVLILPLRKNDPTALKEIYSGLQRLGPRTLLFMREIEEISWSIAGGPSGTYLRDKPRLLGKNTRKVNVIGQDSSSEGMIEETWLVFSREVCTTEKVNVGYIEIAFQLKTEEGEKESIKHVGGNSPLTVFFPTILQTNLGFLVQGPYRTTPSRDNIPSNDTWNKYLIEETAVLLVESLHELLEIGLLKVETLLCLPLDAASFPDNSMFSLLFKKVRTTLSSQPLLPRFNGGFTSAQNAKLARTQEIRELMSSQQLKTLFETDDDLVWLSEEITQDRTPQLRRYLMDELQINEIVPESLLQKLSKSFLEMQSDEWIIQLYKFLRGQPALIRAGRLDDIPIIRLENGTHVIPRKNNKPLAFLPSSMPTDFSTVRKQICSEESLEFLKSLGLREPDPVDDVIEHLLPKYKSTNIIVTGIQYKMDIERLLTAFSTDSSTQRNKLITALRTTPFVAAIDTSNNSRQFALPGEVYQATQRLKDLFDGVPGVLLIDDNYSFLHGEKVRDLLEACGTALYFQPIEIQHVFTWTQKLEMRRKSGEQGMTSEDKTQDFTLRGLEDILNTLPNLQFDQAKAKATILWQALCDVQDRRGTGIFLGTYKWFYFHPRQQYFNAAFVDMLNKSAWVPDINGVLQKPEFVVFENIEPLWENNPFLLSKIHFKPPLINQLAKEVGIEAGVLDLLKKMGLTSEIELRQRLGLQIDGQTTAGPTSPENQEKLSTETTNVKPELVLAVDDSPLIISTEKEEETNLGQGNASIPDQESNKISFSKNPQSSSMEINAGKQYQSVHSKSGSRKFVSYIQVDENEEPDPDGLTSQQRLNLEEKAITLILAEETQLERTPLNNPGFDLIEPGCDNNNPIKFIEVKAMAGSLQDRPVGLSSTQFKCAQKYGELYWLYIVEHAGSPDLARGIYIQNPADKAKTFTFDQGWINDAKIKFFGVINN